MKPQADPSSGDLPSVGTRAFLWTARGLTLAIAAFWGFMAFAHVVGTADDGSRPLGVGDYILLLGQTASVAGLLIAWKWQRPGAYLTLAATLICAAVNWRVVAFPLTFLPATALLYLAYDWLRPSRRRTRAIVSP